MSHEKPHDKWHILYIEDDEEDYLIVSDMLSQSRGRGAKLRWESSFERGCARLDESLREDPGRYDAILVDYDLGKNTGTDIVRRYSALYPAPFVLFTGRGSYEIDLEAMEAGATLYLTKGEVNALTLERFIRYAIETWRAKRELDRSTRQKTIILESMQDGLFGVDRDWRVTYINRPSAVHAHMPPEEALGRPLWEVFPQIQGTVFERHYRQVMAERAPLQFEAQAAAGTKWYRVSVSPSSDGISVNWQDITDQKQAADLVKRSEEKFSVSFHSSPVAMGISRVSDGRFVDVNERFTELLGYSREEVLGRTGLELGIYISPPDREYIMRQLETQGSVQNYEIELRTKAGQGITLLFSNHLVEIGGEACILTNGVDITERVKMEAALRATNEALSETQEALRNERNRLLAVFEALPVGIAIMNRRGGIELQNRAFSEVWDSPTPVANEVRDYAGYEAWWVETGKRLQPEDWAAAQALRTGKTVMGQNILIRRPDGSAAYIVNSGAPVLDAEGSITGSAVASLDITGRVQAEKARAESEERFQVALAAVPMLVYECDRDLRYTWVYNPLRGFKSEDIIGKRDDEVLPPGDADAMVAAKRRAIETGQGAVQEVMVPMNGEPFYYILTTEPKRDEHGQVTGLVCSALDITPIHRAERELAAREEEHRSLLLAAAGERQKSAELLEASEKKFALMFEKSPFLASLTTFEDQRIVDVNDAWVRAFGFSREEAIGQATSALGLRLEPEVEQDFYRRFTEQGFLRDFEMALRTRSGEARTMLWNIKPIEIQGRRYLLNTGQDITERKQAEKALQAAYARLQFFVDSNIAGVVVSSEDGRVVEANDYFLTLVGYTRAEFEAGLMDWRAMTPPEYLALDEQAMEEMQAGGACTPYEKAYFHKDGHLVWAHLRPARQPDGRYAVFVIDISERRRAEDSMNHYAAELERSNQALQEFVSIAAHDLQEPLRKIQSFGHLLESRYSTPLGDEGRAYTRRMAGAARRMSHMLNDLLAYARVTSQAQPFEATDLNRVLAETLEDLEGRIAETGGSVEAGPLLTIQAEPVQMRLLFQNLISNALKYHREGVPPRVEVSCALQADGSVQIAVADNGMGMARDEIPRLFEPFVRLEGRGSKVDGTGMGLAICKKIVERHGGTITVESRPGEGSTFSIILPRNP